MGVFPRLAHHSTSVRSTEGTSSPLFHSLHCFSFISFHSQPFPLSSLIFLYSLFPLSLARLFLSSLCSSCSLSLPFPLYSAVQFTIFIPYNFSHLFLFFLLFSSTPVHIYSPLSPNRFSSAPSQSVSTISMYDCPRVEFCISVRNLGLSQKINYNYT